MAGPPLATFLLAVGAKAIQNALLHLLVKPAPSTAVMTGNVVAATIAVVRLAAVPGDRPAARTAFDNAWPLIAGFAVGCAIAAAAAGAAGHRAWLVPPAVSLAVTAWLWHRPVDASS